jgi:tetratricopeptide (TPR) repeat protein
MAEAAGFLTEALQIGPGDPELLVELAEVEAFCGLLDDSDRAFDRALELVAPQDSGALISAWLRRGRWLRGGVCHPRESRRSYRNALDVLDRDPAYDLPARAEALAGMAWAEAVAGDPAAVDELLAETDAILGGGSPGDLLAHDIGVARAHALIRAGQFTGSFAPLIAASAAAGRAGRPDMAYSCLSVAAAAAAAAGEFARALDFADRCLPLVVPNGLLRLSVYAQTARSAILRRMGRPAAARRACDAAAGYADRVGLAELDGLVSSERGLLALAACNPAGAAAELTRALDLGAPVSRAATRLRLAEALVLVGQPDQAEAALRGVALEPVSPSDFPATLVAHMSRMQGLVASARGDVALAERRLADSVAAWQRIARTQDSRQTAAGYVASLIDLGRPPVCSLVEPARELATVEAELSTLGSEHAVKTHQE